MKEPKVSVIVPVYNAEKYLHRCVDSILGQTFTDFELLLVDDGSTDGSAAICDEYANLNSRVRVFHKPNGGVSSARNLGLDYAKGEWIAFIDSDDWVSADYLKNLMGNSEGVDLVFNYATRHDEDKVYAEEYPNQLINSTELYIPLRDNDLIWHTSPWSKLFNRNLIEKIGLRFPLNMHIGEDAVFLFTYMFSCSRIRFICTCDYQYRIDGSESLTKRLNSFESERTGYHKINEISEKLRKFCKADSELLKKVDWLTGSYLRRCLNALYHDKICKIKRIKFLSDTDFTSYIKGVNENSMQGKIYQMLINLRLFHTYDLLRRNIVKITK